MPTAQSLSGEVHVENLGGIDETTVAVEPGVTVLAGRNATNRTSLLRAVMAALGSDSASLKADADEGHVALELGGATYTRTFQRDGGTVVRGGDPYLEDAADVELAELFAFLLESNETRRAVARGVDLRELIMRPVDTEAIQTEIDRAIRERDRLDDELERLEALGDRLPALEERRRELEAEIEEAEAELESRRKERDAVDANVRSAQAEHSELETKMAELQSARTEFNRTRQRLETERDSVSSLEAELEELREELSNLPDPAGLEDLESRMEALRERQSRLDGVVTELQSIIEFNEKLLSGSGTGVRQALRDGTDGPSTDELLPETERGTVCWTCGSEVERGEIEGAIEQLRAARQDTLTERSAVRTEIEELSGKRREHEQRSEQRERLERRIERAESEIEERRERIADLEAEREEVADRIEALEAEVTSLQESEQDELLELNRAVNELEFERDQLAAQLEDVDTQIDDVESGLKARPELEADREAVTQELRELRDRIDSIETAAIESFNEHMAAVLEVLDYENLERIWVERRGEGDATRFELKIVRSDDDGAVFEDTLDHLSESEREVTGIVFGLAGYLVHDVHETVPVMVLDSIEAIDSDRIARLLEYVSTYAESILVALLPEDAAAVDDDYRFVRDI
jgi:predicted RNase H-like nuclease (RuvC/YqgF family)